MLLTNVDLHQYYRETINLKLLPTAKNIMNEFMEKSILSRYTSGESMMHYYKCRLMVGDAKNICYNSILTQRIFFNTIHIDKKSILSQPSTKKIIDLMEQDLKNNKYHHANRYVKNFEYE